MDKIVENAGLSTPRLTNVPKFKTDFRAVIRCLSDFVKELSSEDFVELNVVKLSMSNLTSPGQIGRPCLKPAAINMRAFAKSFNEEYLSVFFKFGERYQDVKAMVDVRTELVSVSPAVYRITQKKLSFSTPLGADNFLGWSQFVRLESISNDKRAAYLCFTLNVTSAEEKSNNAPDPVVELIQSVKTIFETGASSDVSIKVGNIVIKAHKSILSARSSVFSAMFDTNTRENNDNVVEITDLSYESVCEVLRFIYCGEVRKLNELKMELLHAAKKYELNSLKAICEEALVREIKTDNYYEILEILRFYKCTNSRSKVVDFIVKNPQILASKEFEKLAACDPQLMVEVIKKQEK